MEPVLGVVGEHVDVHLALVGHVPDDEDREKQIGEERLELLAPVVATARPRGGAKRGGLGEPGAEEVTRARRVSFAAQRRGEASPTPAVARARRRLVRHARGTRRADAGGRVERRHRGARDSRRGTLRG